MSIYLFSKAMSKTFIKLYSGYDFDPTEHDSLRRIVFSPDNIHSISLVSLADGTLLITNEKKIGFDFSISRGRKVIAIVKWKPQSGTLLISTNWMLNSEGVANREIHSNPYLGFSKFLNIELKTDEEIVRADLKVDESGFACCVFSMKDLLFMRFNGNHAMPRLVDVINSPPLAQKVNEFMATNPDFRKEIGQNSFQN